MQNIASSRKYEPFDRLFVFIFVEALYKCLYVVFVVYIFHFS